MRRVYLGLQANWALEELAQSTAPQARAFQSRKRSALMLRFIFLQNRLGSVGIGLLYCQVSLGAAFSVPLLTAMDVITIINSLKQMLDMEPDDLLHEVDPFSSLVDDLRNHSWRLSPLEAEFLQRLLRLREELVADAPFINLVEEAEVHYHEMASGVFDHIWLTKESMRMHEGTLAALFNDEEMIDKRVAKLEGEIQRHDMLYLKDKQNKLGEMLSEITDDLKLVRRCKRSIEEKRVGAKDVAELL
ncbi:hypothetical protein TSUD_185090 [Trifolium subterraneum]|uniref:Uncharacterized protein n=1 Tax=Trifolium subterraneum TaxID=3900 RepID=A0A2Z6NIL2_TRISU|nr:hypothetical protein TSUD_185090 [Trifolium subterraneum]